MQTQFTSIDGLKIRFAAKSGNFKETLLLLSPLPESILAFQPMWEVLSEQFNLLAIDLPGFGRSESRKDLFSTREMAGFVLKVIEHFKLGATHILGPDIGTPIALFVAAKHPEMVKSIIISGGACVFPLLVTNVLKDIIEAPDLDAFKQLSVKDIIDGSLSEFKRYILPDKIREDYYASYEGGRLFESMEILRAYKTDIPELDSYIDHIEVPVQIIWGENDPIAPVENAHILHRRLRKNKLSVLNGQGHYTWEEGWTAYLPIVSQWLNGDYLNIV
jgi:pimeloyl-ACP methyl ester carboxylesterase